MTWFKTDDKLWGNEFRYTAGVIWNTIHDARGDH